MTTSARFATRVLLEVPAGSWGDSEARLEWLGEHHPDFLWRPCEDIIPGREAPGPLVDKATAPASIGQTEPRDLTECLEGTVLALARHSETMRHTKLAVTTTAVTPELPPETLEDYARDTHLRVRSMVNQAGLRTLRLPRYEQIVRIAAQERSFHEIVDEIPDELYSYCVLLGSPLVGHLVLVGGDQASIEMTSARCVLHLKSGGVKAKLQPLQCLAGAWRVGTKMRDPSELTSPSVQPDAAVMEQIVGLLRGGQVDVDTAFAHVFGLPKNGAPRKLQKRFNLAVDELSSQKILRRDGKALSPRTPPED